MCVPGEGIHIKKISAFSQNWNKKEYLEKNLQITY